METDVRNGVVESFYVVLKRNDMEELRYIRHWNHLKISFDKEEVWLTNFTPKEIHSTEIKTLANKTVFESHGNKLYKLGNILPDRVMPSLLWSPIERVLTIEKPEYNHNFFELNSTIRLVLVDDSEPKETVAILSPLVALEKEVMSVSSVRINRLTWVVLKNEALTLGTPLLGIAGKAYWMFRQSVLLPLGKRFEFEYLAVEWLKNINPTNNYIVLMHEDNSYSLIKKTQFKQLSVSSFKRTKRLVQQ